MSRNFEDFDEKNIEIAKMLINDSEKITIDEKTNEKIIKSIRNGRKKKFTGIYKMATAVAACIVLVAGMTIWNHVNTKEGYKSSSEKSMPIITLPHLRLIKMFREENSQIPMMRLSQGLRKKYLDIKTMNGALKSLQMLQQTV